MGRVTHWLLQVLQAGSEMVSTHWPQLRYLGWEQRVQPEIQNYGDLWGSRWCTRDMPCSKGGIGGHC